MSSKVVLLRCESYDVETVYQRIKNGISMLGGITKFFDKSEKILLKPNVLAGREPDKAVTTHPAVFEAIIRILQENGNEIIYGDSPGFDKPMVGLKKSGLKDVADKYNINHGDFENYTTIIPNDPIIAKDFNIVNAVKDSDAIISLSKMKTHQLTRITGAIKNQFGCVCGINKAMYHVKLPNANNFCKMLIDLNKLLKVRLYIMDGIIAMEGNGPASGTPTKMNVILISQDPVAIDATFCKMINLNPEFIPSITYGKQYGLGTYLDHEIEYLGDPILSFVNKDFDVVRLPISKKTTLKIFEPIERLITSRPIIDKTKCTKCGICVKSCPVDGKAVNFRDPVKPPKYDYKKCIRCFCCQEVCPNKAIKVKKGLFSK